MKKKPVLLMGDFETTVYDEQEYTEVWASVLVELYTEDAILFNSIDDTWEHLKKIGQPVIVYYHNLKFDGTFWLDFFQRKTKLKQAYIRDDNGEYTWLSDKDMPSGSYKYSISDLGQWYQITIKHNRHMIRIRDSMKLLPFSVKRIGDAFKTKHRKTEMVYTGFRYAGCVIKPEEQEYIKNDAFVVKEALEIMFDQGHDELTIGSCCLKEFRHCFDSFEYRTRFPDLYAIGIDADTYGSPSAGEYIHNSYRGGWCYLVRGKENRLFRNGMTADVNSLYPSMMHSMSGNRYPVGKPVFWSGNYIPEEARKENRYFFVRIRCRFRLKEGYLPFIQIKRNPIYRSTEMLETSDYRDYKTGRYYRYYRGFDGVKHDTYVTLTLTMTDYELVKRHYDLIDMVILDGCIFYSDIGIFDSYIDKYKEIKMNSTGAIRELAKLFLNNLYGKMATSTDSSFKVAILEPDGVVRYHYQEEHDKKPGYIAIGSAITSYARRFTIEAAQANYHGPDKPGFIYADTDSIHCDLQPEDLVNVPEHNTEFCHWKYESLWDEGWFVRQKTYIEHVTHDTGRLLEEPKYHIKCAGMPDKCKQLFQTSMNGREEGETEEEKEFTRTKRTIEDFTTGLLIPGKLLPKQIPGGTLLVETTYEMR